MNTSLYEVSRKNLVGKTKVQSPQRYNKRLGYRMLSHSLVDPNTLLKNDFLITRAKVGDYNVYIAYSGVLSKLKNIVTKKRIPNVTLQNVIKAVTKAIDETDVFVHCSCPDWRYRFSFWATQHGYKFGKPESRPAKITNPNDKIGAMCKHITALLSNKKWLIKVASSVNAFIKAYYEDVLEVLDLSPEEFIINVPGRPSAKTGKNIAMMHYRSKQLNSNTIEGDEV